MKKGGNRDWYFCPKRQCIINAKKRKSPLLQIHEKKQSDVIHQNSEIHKVWQSECGRRHQNEFGMLSITMNPHSIHKTT